ncbi:MAG: hypothetical protein GKR89_15555 [Candidatus Latescibacteria bacterium]|nr:hypothetical protein [Candidatus Latescibacterota bacterium]
MNAELPARAFFNYRVPLAPRPKNLRLDGRLSEWDEGTLLPDLGALEGSPGFAQVHLAWDPQGLYLALDVANKTSVAAHRQRPQSADALLIWIDTRDVRDVHRATRFCHHFIALPRGGGSGRQSATAWQQPIRRAREEAPLGDGKKIRVASNIHPTGYSLELALPAAVLNGYDPDECARLGFTYLVCDHEHGWQTWATPGAHPYQFDPSTWATVELVQG